MKKKVLAMVAVAVLIVIFGTVKPWFGLAALGLGILSIYSFEREQFDRWLATFGGTVSTSMLSLAFLPSWYPTTNIGEKFSAILAISIGTTIGLLAIVVAVYQHVVSNRERHLQQGPVTETVGGGE